MELFTILKLSLLISVFGDMNYIKKQKPCAQQRTPWASTVWEACKNTIWRNFLELIKLFLHSHRQKNLKSLISWVRSRSSLSETYKKYRKVMTKPDVFSAPLSAGFSFFYPSIEQKNEVGRGVTENVNFRMNSGEKPFPSLERSLTSFVFTFFFSPAVQRIRVERNFSVK